MKNRLKLFLRHRRAVDKRRPLVEAVESRLLFSGTVNAWKSAVSGDWDTSANWTLGHVPLASEDVQITVAGNYSVGHSVGKTDAVHSLVSTHPFTMSSGTLTLGTTAQVSNLFTLAGGTLSGGTILRGSGGQGVIVTKGTLSGVAVDTDLTVTAFDTLVISNSFTVTGKLTLTNATLQVSGKTSYFLPATSLDGVSLVATGGATLSAPNVTSVTITSTRGGYTPRLEADNSGSSLLLPNLTTMNGGTLAGQGWHVNAYSGAA